MLALVTVAFTIGIAVGDWLSIGVGPGIPLVLGAAAVVAAARARGRLIGSALLVLALALGVLAQAGARPRAPPELIGSARWRVEAEVAALPERAFGATRVPVELRSVERDGMRRDAGGGVMVLIGGDPVEPLLPGDRVRFSSPLRAPRGFLDPGGVDGARRAAASGVMALAGVHAPAALSRLAGVPPPPSLATARALGAWRNTMLGEVRARLDGDRRALVASLVLGDRGDVDRRLDDEFRVAGVSHVLSVSGLHLAIAAFLFYAGLTRLLLRVPRLARGRPVRRWAALAAIPAAGVYTLITGSQVATVRACVVAAVWLGAVVLGRRVTAASALAMAALAILAVSPLELFDPSFQLSFAAALGTALLAPRFSPSSSGGARLHARLGRWVWRLCAASAAAILATAPISAWHFSQVSPAGIFSNLVVVPLAELLIVPTGLSGCVLASAHLPPGGALIQLAGIEAGAMAEFVRWCAAWAPSWRVPAPSLIELCAWYGGLLAIALARPRWRAWALGCALVVGASLGARAWLPSLSNRLVATFLDVGQGDACVLELPRGHAVVIDGGGSFDPAFDPGEQVIAPFLWRRGIRRLDLVILSHPHPDHANGLGFLVEHFPVGEVWTNGQETKQPGTVRLLDAAARRGVPRGPPRAVEIGGVSLRPLAPLDGAGQVAIDPARSENDNSLVVAVEYRGRRLLFAGDLEAEGEAALVGTAGERLRSDVLKVPHHGSRTSSTDALLDAARPGVAVISVGERNRWGFPNPAVLARYQAHGARVLRTDRNGAISVSVSGAGRLDVESMR